MELSICIWIMVEMRSTWRRASRKPRMSSVQKYWYLEWMREKRLFCACLFTSAVDGLRDLLEKASLDSASRFYVF